MTVVCNVQYVLCYHVVSSYVLGVLLCMTHHKHNPNEVHNRLMALNVTLRSMLDVEEAAYHEMVSSTSITPPLW